MLCENQTVLTETCEDGTSKKIQCKLGFENTCMKRCREGCPKFSYMAPPKQLSRPVAAARPTRYNPVGAVVRSEKYGCGGCGGTEAH